MFRWIARQTSIGTTATGVLIQHRGDRRLSVNASILRLEPSYRLACESVAVDHLQSQVQFYQRGIYAYRGPRISSLDLAAAR